MLKKLMKYEFMATGRVFLPMFVALIVLSVVNKLLSYLSTSTPQVIGTVVSVILMVGIFILTLILTLQRFRSNMLSSEGYLMMTLPVNTDRLILSKMFVSTVWIITSAIVVTVSIMIMAMVSFSIRDFTNGIRRIYEYLAITPAQFTVYLFEGIVIIVISLFSAILLLYACMSLSMLVNKRRGLFTFGAFIVITTAMQIIGTFLMFAANKTNIARYFDFTRLDSFGLSQVVILVCLIIEVVVCLIFYFVTRYMLKNKLNLQ